MSRTRMKVVSASYCLSLAMGTLALGAIVFSFSFSVKAQTAPQADQSVQSNGVPVSAGVASIKDIPIFVTGIGSIQAYNTVSVKSRVDGQIMQVLFKEGQEVKAGDPLFQIDPRPYQAVLDQASANKRKDEGQLAGAQLNLTRYTKLLSTGFQTRQSYDDQKATVVQLQGSVAADQAAIESARLNLVYSMIRSPIGGRTGARLVDQGNFIQASAGTALVSITQVKPIFVSFTVPQENLDAIREAQNASPLDVEAFSPDGRKNLADGKLTLVDNQVETTTGTIHLKAAFANTGERLWPGAFANVRLILGERRNVVTVPVQTVMQGPSGPYAFVLKPNDTVERRELQVAATQDGIAVITQGIAANERVVTDGQYRLTPGSYVKIGQPKAGSTPSAS